MAQIAGDQNLTMCFDGWTPKRGDSVVSVTLVSKASNKEVFLTCVQVRDLSGNTEDKANLVKLIEREIKKINESDYDCRVSSLAGDNARVVESAIAQVVNNNHSLIPIGCNCHSFSLFIKDICDIFEPVALTISTIISKILNRSKLKQYLYRYRDLHRRRFDRNRNLEKFVPTRWGSMNNMCSRVVEWGYLFDEMWKNERSQIRSIITSIKSNPSKNDEEDGTAINECLEAFFSDGKKDDGSRDGVPYRTIARNIVALIGGLSKAITHLEAVDSSLHEILALIHAFKHDQAEWVEAQKDETWHQDPVFNGRWKEKTLIDPISGALTKKSPSVLLGEALEKIINNRETGVHPFGNALG
jgi:hypothetical protein